MIRIFKKAHAHLLLSMLFTGLLFLTSCTESADRFFGIAVLNTNSLREFGMPVFAKRLDDETKEFPNVPSSKKKGDEAQKRIANSILYIEKSLKEIKELSESGDKKEIKQLSLELYELVLPVYKNEYMAYAKLCDTKAPQEQKDLIIKAIDEKYNDAFEKKYALLLEKGKAFAIANNLNVKWD
ncbi:hypothetical protein [Pedobacter caeni]|uniref:Lipoprotein n=1 Tax=Pedobacter caeni TaxID=288992 RepID=A0A1M5AAY9_9SPHI|nr:hypothetical protein [Pedobacter caeni]SHF27471.1 hypothetical protein SAMN04488522_102668 [Pedobacter caeni]